MAVPKRKLSKVRRDNRRSQHKVSDVNTVKCPKCGAKTLPHTTCKKCGTYYKKAKKK